MITRQPTTETYQALQSAYDYLNDNLFDGELPACLITIRPRAKAYGYFSPGRFAERGAEENAGDPTDEISLNPQLFNRTDREILSTLAHEQAHLWIQHFGSPPKRSIHCRAWATRMKEIGLYPSGTGQPGGKETGYHVSHYIIPGGPFDRVAVALLATGYRIPWGELPTPPATRSSQQKHKYTCPGCSLNAWGKESISLICGECGKPLGAAS